MRLELATTYGPQISEELLAIRIGKDIQLSLETPWSLLRIRKSPRPATLQVRRVSSAHWDLGPVPTFQGSIQGLLGSILEVELATTYGPQISEELLAIRIGKDIQLSLETLVFAADSKSPRPNNSSGTSCFFCSLVIWGL